MTKRTRSPNYPGISLPEALDRLGELWNSIERHAAPRDIVAKGLGYSGLHGASVTAISAIQKYGLLERHQGELKISDRGLMCLHPTSPAERVGAIQAAAAGPKLFAELEEQFPGGTNNEELLRNHLLRIGFTSSAATNALLAYRETRDFVAKQITEDDLSPADPDQEADVVIQPAGGPIFAPGQGRVEEPAQPGPSVPASRFVVSMTDEFLINVNATRLDRQRVNRLIDWLQANAALVPETEAPE